MSIKVSVKDGKISNQKTIGEGLNGETNGLELDFVEKTDSGRLSTTANVGAVL